MLDFTTRAHARKAVSLQAEQLSRPRERKSQIETRAAVACLASPGMHEVGMMTHVHINLLRRCLNAGEVDHERVDSQFGGELVRMVLSTVVSQ